MKYPELLQSLSRRGLFRIHPGLDRVRTVLDALGNPQDRFRSIHVAGTNGKGSVAVALEALLRHAGYCTGLYTSPHLIDVRERIAIGRVPISIERFEATAEEIFAAERQTQIALTYFEFLTAVAFLAYAETKVDIAIIETGLGGRWDATNVLSRPEVCVITSIGKDHMQWLGRTEIHIAREKAGIIKPGVPIVSGARGRPSRVIAETARRHGASFWPIDQSFAATGLRAVWSGGFQEISYRGGMGRRFRFGLLGTHQIDNASVACKTGELLQEKGWTIPEAAFREGMARIQWPGRMQILPTPTGPIACLDGAHNVAAVRRLLQTLQASPWHTTPKTWIVGIYRDKEYHSMARLIAPHVEHLVLCRLPGSRGLSTRLLHSAFAAHLDRKINPIASDPATALDKALAITPRDEMIVVTGSLALIGILLKQLRGPLSTNLNLAYWASNRPKELTCV
jgi:dihydrofolate synthase/folylpolyglutamate synthase